MYKGVIRMVAGMLFPVMGLWMDARAETPKIGGTGSALGVMRLLGQEYSALQPATALTVLPRLGSGSIKALIAGKLDIAVSPRALKNKKLIHPIIERPFGRMPIVFAMNGVQEEAYITAAEFRKIDESTLRNWPTGRLLSFNGVEPRVDTLQSGAYVACFVV